MSHSTLFKGSAAIMAAFGVVLLLAPNLLLKAYSAPLLNSPGNYNTMLYGGVLIGLAVMNWSAAAARLDQLRPLVLGNLVADVLGLAVTLYLQVTDPVVPTAAWGNVVLFLAFTVLFGRLQLRYRWVSPSGMSSKTSA
jgi:hypothetical protein